MSKTILGSQPRKWGKLMQAAGEENGNKRASIDSTTTATGLAIDTSATRLSFINLCKYDSYCNFLIASTWAKFYL